MKISRILLSAAVAANLFVVGAFAVPAQPNPASPNNTLQKNDTIKRDKNCDENCKYKHRHGDKEIFKDPVKALEAKKERVLKLQQEGKISKEKAEEITRKIDSRIKEMQEFNKLTVEQKREMLIVKLKEAMAAKVKEGKITQEKADEMILRFTKKIESWDGNGYPGFFYKMHINKSRTEHKDNN